MKEFIKKIAKYNKTERIQRLCEIFAKGENATPFDHIEAMMIQFIREQNGEIDSVKEMQRMRDEINKAEKERD